MPDVAVAVASHDRPARLRFLLNALEEQTLERERLEVVVAHDAPDGETARVLAEHPLREAGLLRPVPAPPGAPLAALRNAGWRAARADLVAFTDDDCRPERDWLERLLAAALERPGAVAQGRTLPDPDEAGLLWGAPWARTVNVEPPSPWGETSNIAYPTALLEELGGFDEGLSLPAGEDADLAARARAAGADTAPVPEAVVYHAVHTPWLGRRVAWSWRWQQLAAVVGRHPELRRGLPGRIWWRREHAALALAGAGVVLAGRRRGGALLAAPWLALALRHRGYGPRGLARATSELPGRALVDASELAALAWGSLRHRSLLL
jgi:GT2 family glycosyltransferase